MSDTLPNVFLPAGEWVDLYAVSKIVVGSVIAVQNIGVTDGYLSAQKEQPANTSEAYCVIQRLTGDWYRNEENDLGAWAFSERMDGKLSIRKVE